MKKEVFLDYFICNGKLLSTKSMEDIDVLKKISSKSVYEVIKIKEGVPLFFDEHLERMKNSLFTFGIELKKTKQEILQEILQLVKVNRCKFINVKLVYDFLQKKDCKFLIYFIESEYPQKDSYKNGVHTILFQGERKNPNVKTIYTSFKERVKQIRKQEGAYEALLVDEDGYIKEGSRSNVFFIKENILLTPPAGEVLLGVTRNYVLKICHKLGIQVKENPIHINHLKDIDGAFITGTTVDILPIASINQYRLRSTKNPIMKKIMNLYEKEMNKDIQKRKEKLSNYILF
ncbi:aminotransferase class IV [Garciella nitratireducens]|uniref:Branched-chain amino acid aminotransferase n=1 Tax=Garciella nitratireducens DSM 15102 TaxID=1121911 RepID=A0A1T4KRV7_9FIRM|nr:aminotransferase class IV [Garciella nitratireducens]SJZ45067.1 branched-chain amino acid aminotransferase [Garciella nitratireducens DSM 15102]